MINRPVRIALLGTFPVRSKFDEGLEFTASFSFEHPSSPLVNLAPQLALDKELDVHVVTLHPHLKKDYLIENDRVTYHLLRGGRLSLQILTFYQLDKNRLISMLDRLRPDVVQAFGTEGPYALAAAECCYPSIIYMQGVANELVKSTPPKFNLNWLRLFMTQFTEKNVVRMAGNFIAESSFSEGFVRRLNPSAKIHRMKNLIHPLYFQTGRKPVDSLRVILFIGRVTEEKGIFELLHAFAKIHDKHPEVKLEFIGPIHDPLEDARLRDSVRELGLAESVSFSGLQPVSYITERLAEACMMAYPSYMDTSPNSIYEAMAVGTAVIGARVGGIPDMVEDGVTGLLVQPRDSESLARAMNFLFDYPEENQRIGQNAKSSARAELESAQTIRNIKKLYMSLL